MQISKNDYYFQNPWTSGEESEFSGDYAITFGGGPISTYVPEVYGYQTQLLLEDHNIQTRDWQGDLLSNEHTNIAGEWIRRGYPDPYPNIYREEFAYAITEIPYYHGDLYI